jgi:transcriptional regulator with XRE-family HTH domain
MAHRRKARVLGRRAPRAHEPSATNRLAAQIRSARLAAGLTQRALAERLGKSLSWVAAAEKGRRRIFINDLPRIADALGMELRELLRRAL